MNVSIILGYTDSYPKPATKAVTPPLEESWFEQKFVMLGTIVVVLSFAVFSIVPVFV
jgi:hypothetical protein